MERIADRRRARIHALASLIVAVALAGLSGCSFLPATGAQSPAPSVPADFPSAIPLY